jgi:hypothetical protein
MWNAHRNKYLPGIYKKKRQENENESEKKKKLTCWFDFRIFRSAVHPAIRYVYQFFFFFFE